MSSQTAETLTRITPAGAGKTNKKDCNYFLPQDHPRRCGENRYTICMPEWLDRITPAGAGKTPSVPQR